MVDDDNGLGCVAVWVADADAWRFDRSWYTGVPDILIDRARLETTARRPIVTGKSKQNNGRRPAYARKVLDQSIIIKGQKLEPSRSID